MGRHHGGAMLRMDPAGAHKLVPGHAAAVMLKACLRHDAKMLVSLRAGMQSGEGRRTSHHVMLEACIQVMLEAGFEIVVGRRKPHPIYQSERPDPPRSPVLSSPRTPPSRVELTAAHPAFFPPLTRTGRVWDAARSVASFYPSP
jgi:hypothetical protein